MRKSVFAIIFAAMFAAMAMTPGCSGVPARVPKTGAAADKIGVNFPRPRFTVNAGCTVTDNLTGLIWLKDANLANTVGYDPDGTRDGRVQWANADALVTALNAGTAPFAGKNCGYTDWRVPNRNELNSLIHAGYTYPALSDTAGTGKWTEGNPFDNVQIINVQTSYYWSATTYSGDTTRAWYVNLGGGSVSAVNKMVTDYVWPVRGGQ